MIDLREALEQAIAQAQAVAEQPVPRPEAPATPVVDLRGLDVVCEPASANRVCDACRGLIPKGQMHVRHMPAKNWHVRSDHFHTACAEI